MDKLTNPHEEVIEPIVPMDPDLAEHGAGQRNVGDRCELAAEPRELAS